MTDEQAMDAASGERVPLATRARGRNAAELLGSGSVVIRATGRAGPTPADAVNAAPVTIEVTDAP